MAESIHQGRRFTDGQCASRPWLLVLAIATSSARRHEDVLAVGKLRWFGAGHRDQFYRGKAV